MKDLQNKVVVITGAGSGIGRALSINFASRGARLALSDLDARGLEETAALVSGRSGSTPHTASLDVSDRQAVAAYAPQVAAAFGVVNVLVNNAGIGQFGEFEHLTYDQFDRIMNVDFWGVVHGTKEFLPALIASGDGHLVNVSSVCGLVSLPSQSAYNAAKFGVRGFTETLRQEMRISGHNVGVTCVHPGFIKTPIATRSEYSGSNNDPSDLQASFDKMARTTAEKAAEDIVKGVLKNRPRVVIGADAKALDVLGRVAGPGYQRVVSSLSVRARRS